MTDAPPSKGERTQARILEAAVAAFGASGFRATSVAAIARDAGVSPPAAFAYWPSKEALYEAAVDADATAVIGQLLGDLEASTDGNPWLRLVDRLLVIVERHPLALRVLAGREPEVVDRVLELPAFDQLRSQLTELITLGQDAGLIRTDVEPKQLAVGMETITIALVTWRLQLSTAPSRARQSGVAEVLLAAFRAPG